MLSNLYQNPLATTQSKHRRKRKANLLQHNRKDQRQRAQRCSSTTRPPSSHTSNNEHSKPKYNLHAVENGVRFRAGPFAEAGAVLGQELVGDDDEGLETLLLVLDWRMLSAFTWLAGWV